MENLNGSVPVSATAVGRRCPKCGTPMNPQTVNQYHAGRKGHGCLYTIFFGLWYWCWLGFKWFIQFMYKCLAWIFWLICVIFFYIYAVFANVVRLIMKKSRSWSIPKWINAIGTSSIHQSRHEKNKMKTVWVCPHCGNTVNA